MEFPINKKFLELAKTISQNNGRLFIVGGAVRDYCLGQEPHDIDYCVTGIDEDTLKKISNISRVQGESFPVFIIDGCEVAFARAEKKIGDGHTSFSIDVDTSITIEQDLARRDITINSMAIDVLDGKLIDPFNGLEDLKQKIIRKTTEAFVEDPLRVYRVARFASKLGYSVSEDTIETMRQMKYELGFLSEERVLSEFRRALVEKNPSKFFEVLKRAGVLEAHFKELFDLIGVEQPKEYHPEGDAFVHTMIVLEKVAEMTPNAQIGSDEELTRFCALVHDFGKGATPPEEWPHHYGHEERGINLVHEFCRRLKTPIVFEKAGKLISKNHMKLGRFNSLKAGTKEKVLEEIYKSKSISFKGAEIIAIADSKDDTVAFVKLAEEIFKIKATEEMKLKCTTDVGLEYERLKELLFQKRVMYIKNYLKDSMDESVL